ncbi:MAG TPA: hypothetical protein V6D17_11160 [Candidatus Obscuribacterales bacterium]
MDFEERSLEMILRLLETLIEKGEIVSRHDAVQKIQSDDWLIKKGYSHIAHVLRGPIGMRACEQVYSIPRLTAKK